MQRLGDMPFMLTALTEAEDLAALAAAIEPVPTARAIASETEIAGEIDLVIGLDVPAALPGRLVGAPLLLAADPLPSRIHLLLGLDRRETAPALTELRHVSLSAGLVPMRLLVARLPGAAIATDVPVTPVIAADPTNAFAGALADLLGAERIDLAALSLLPEAPLVLFIDDFGALPERLAALALLARLAPVEGVRAISLVTHISTQNPTHSAALLGARRVLANEAPTLAVRLIQVALDLATLPRLAAELVSARLAWLGGGDAAQAGRRTARDRGPRRWP